MTASDVVRYVSIIALGFLGFLTFIYAATIVGLMWVESGHCNCWQLPVGLYVLALIGILFIVALISEGIDAQPDVEWLLANRREAVVIALITLLIIILILL